MAPPYDTFRHFCIGLPSSQNLLQIIIVCFSHYCSVRLLVYLLRHIINLLCRWKKNQLHCTIVVCTNDFSLFDSSCDVGRPPSGSWENSGDTVTDQLVVSLDPDSMKIIAQSSSSNSSPPKLSWSPSCL